MIDGAEAVAGKAAKWIGVVPAQLPHTAASSADAGQPGRVCIGRLLEWRRPANWYGVAHAQLPQTAAGSAAAGQPGRRKSIERLLE